MAIDLTNEMEEYFGFIVKSTFNLKDELMVRIMEHVSGKKIFRSDDLKKFTIINHVAYKDKEFISYENSIVGYIKMKHREDESNIVIGLEFTPCSNYE